MTADATARMPDNGEVKRKETQILRLSIYNHLHN
jgi:hypothetical protein